MFASPFPDVAFAAAHRSEMAACTPLSEEQALLPPGAAPKRILEFMLGRLAAHRALQQLGFGSGFAVLRGAGGQPLWPPGVAGSITHSGDFAYAAAAREAAGIGIDLERIPESFAHDISSRVCRPRELAWVQADHQLSVERSVRVFSAKEALFKALYPLCGRRFGFLDVELEARPEGFAAVLLFDAAPGFEHGRELQLSSQQADGYILSAVRLER